MATYDPGDEPRRCCAKSSQRQERCRNPVVPGRKVCRVHGGRGGRPAISGRYSRYIQSGAFAQAYRDAISDSSIWDLEEHLAVLEAACRRCAERMEELDTPQFRADALALVGQCEAAREAGEWGDFASAFLDLAALVRRGASEDRALGELLTTTERRAKRLEEAWKIRLNAAHAINSRDLVTVMARFVDIVEANASPAVAAKIRETIEVELLRSHEMAA